MHQSSNYANVDIFHNPIGVDAPSEFDTGNYWGDPDGHYNTNCTAFDKQDLSMFYKTNKELVSPGDSIKLPIDIARTEEDIHRTIIGKGLNRHRSLIYHYELRHKPLYKTCQVYRDSFNKIYKFICF